MQFLLVGFVVIKFYFIHFQEYEPIYLARRTTAIDHSPAWNGALLFCTLFTTFVCSKFRCLDYFLTKHQASFYATVVLNRLTHSLRVSFEHKAPIL
jgi:hypothetical protein